MKLLSALLLSLLLASCTITIREYRGSDPDRSGCCAHYEYARAV